MATSTSAIFKGSSAYSSDFTNLISRAVSIASLPVQQLTGTKTQLTSQSDELTKLDTKFSLLQTAVAKVGTALSGSAYKSEVSVDKVVGVTVADGAQEGVYSINVSNIGACESSLSTKNWNVANDLPDSPTTFTLVVGNQNYTISPADHSAKSVVSAINSAFGNLVQATTVNVAPGDTRISLKSVALGATNLDILQSPATPSFTALQSQATTGYAISQTTASWDATGPKATYTLTIGGDEHTITPATDNSAADVVTAINAAYGDQVRASVVDVGANGIPDLRVRLQSTTDGPMNGSMTLDLKKGAGSSLQKALAPAISLSSAPWTGTAEATGSRGTYNLVVGTTRYSFTSADNSAASVAAAINDLYGAQVKASVVDLETGGNPDYRISLQMADGSSTTLNIEKATATHFQVEQTAGVLASYEVNKSGVINTSATRAIAISGGVTANLLATSGGSPVDITVTRSTSALSTALSGLADAYNAAADELAGQRGQSSGALGGQYIVSQLSTLLSNISTFSTSGQVNGLAALGLDLGKDGRFTFNAFTLIGADLANSSGVTSFLGTTTGGGFLKSASDILNSVETPITGLLKTTAADLKSRLTNLDSTIAKKQAQVDALQARMQSQMAAADALIASMEQQSSYFTSMFAAQETANSMYK